MNKLWREDDIFQTYEKTEIVLGYGTLGKVWETKKDEQLFAIKEISQDDDTKSTIEELIKTFRLIENISPFVVMYLDATHLTSNTLQIVLEHIHGTELYKNNYKEGETVSSPQNVYTVMSDVLHALKFLHAHQIIHCDIKGENIILTNEKDWRGSGRAVLIDLDLGDVFSPCETQEEIKNYAGRGCEITKSMGSRRLTSMIDSMTNVPLQDIIEIQKSNDIWASGVSIVEYFNGEFDGACACLLPRRRKHRAENFETIYKAFKERIQYFDEYKENKSQRDCELVQHLNYTLKQMLTLEQPELDWLFETNECSDFTIPPSLQEDVKNQPQRPSAQRLYDSLLSEYKPLQISRGKKEKTRKESKYVTR